MKQVSRLAGEGLRRYLSSPLKRQHHAEGQSRRQHVSWAQRLLHIAPWPLPGGLQV